VIDVLLEVVTPDGFAATAKAIRELMDHHEPVARQRLALESPEYEAQRAERQFDACNPEKGLLQARWERRVKEALAAVYRRCQLVGSRRVRETSYRD
jgi:hypothetical protein